MVNPRNNTLRALLTIAVVVLCAGLFAVVRTNREPSVSEEVSEPQTQQDIAARTESILSFEQILEAINADNTVLALDRAEKYATDEANTELSRLMAFEICISSAIELQNEAKKNQCYDAGLALTDEVATLDASFSDSWKTDLTNTYNQVEQDLSDDEIQ